MARSTATQSKAGEMPIEEVRFRSPSESAGFTQANNLTLLDTKLSDGAKVTYLLLRMYAWQGPSSFPGQKRLAAERGTTDRTIRNHVTEMEARGLVTVEQRGKKLTNRYWLEPLDNVYTQADLPDNRRAERENDSDRKISSAHVTGKKLPPSDRKIISGPSEEDAYILKDSDTLNVTTVAVPGECSVTQSRRRAAKALVCTVVSGGATFNENESDAYKTMVLEPILLVETLTGDTNSRARYVQLREICIEHRRLSAWTAALCSTEKRMKRTGLEPLAKPGAWFDRALVRELDKYGVAVPVNAAQKVEGSAIRGAIAASLGLGAE